MSEHAMSIGDEVTLNASLRADNATLKARRWASDLFAAFAAARAYIWTNFGAQLIEAYGDDEARKIHAEAFKSYAALIDAAAKDNTGSKRRRFHLAAWNAQLFKECKSLSIRLSEEESKREKSRLSRAWHRTGWKPIHQLQRVTHLPFFDREARDFKANREREAATFVDEFTDRLIETMRAVRDSGKRSPWRFNREFAGSVEAWRESEAFKPYAFEWTPEQCGEANAGKVSNTRPDDPTAKIENMIRRASQRAGKVALAGLSDEREIDAVGLAIVEWVSEEWREQTGRALPVRPVSQGADNENKSAAASSEITGKYLSFSSEKPHPTADNLSYVGALGEVLEFEPEAEPRGVSLADAEGAAFACASVGVGRVKVVFIDDTKPESQNVTKTHALSIGEFREQLPALLEYNRREQVSMTTRLRFKRDTRLVQLDDCCPNVMRDLAPFAFLQVATSPGNGQTWLALPKGLTPEQYNELRRRLLSQLKPTGANGGAYGSIRFPGSLNCKPKRRYADGEACRVQLLRAAPGRVVTEADLDAAGLLAPATPAPTPAELSTIKTRFPVEGFPDMKAEIAATGGDRSRGEFAWCMKSLRRGFPPNIVEDELRRAGDKARTRQRDNYARETVEKAARVVGLNPSNRSFQMQNQ